MKGKVVTSLDDKFVRLMLVTLMSLLKVNSIEFLLKAKFTSEFNLNDVSLEANTNDVANKSVLKINFS